MLNKEGIITLEWQQHRTEENYLFIGLSYVLNILTEIKLVS